MADQEKFIEEIHTHYSFEGAAIDIGAAMLEEETFTNTIVRAPLRMFNRHGLIAGATGTGKTKTLQVITEQLSKHGVPSLLMDIKGDLSGLAMPSPGHRKIDERMQQIGLPFAPESIPVELLTISNDSGTRMRATVSEYGPVLFSKILYSTDTQASIISVLFKYCDDNELPLVDLQDLKKIIQYAMNEGKQAMEQEYGRMHPSSLTSILRKIVELEEQGGDMFFGEPSFEIEDFLRTDKQGRGYASILRVTDIQGKPKLFSTFMLCLLAEVYESFPEEGDLEKPKFVIFIDEAHLIFNEATDELLRQIESIIKLIRSKGVGVFFITQNPADVPESVLAQLGMKVQHALRAFTAKDRKAIKLAAENYPLSDYYDTAEVLTQLGIGESLISVLDEKGRPTPLVRTMMRAPITRMDVLTPQEQQSILKKSTIFSKYEKTIDRESAKELLIERIEKAKDTKTPSSSSTRRTSTRKEKSTIEQVIDSTAGRQVARTIAREVTRGLLGVLGIKTTGSRSKKTWF